MSRAWLVSRILLNLSTSMGVCSAKRQQYSSNQPVTIPRYWNKAPAASHLTDAHRILDLATPSEQPKPHPTTSKVLLHVAGGHTAREGKQPTSQVPTIRGSAHYLHRNYRI